MGMGGKTIAVRGSVPPLAGWLTWNGVARLRALQWGGICYSGWLVGCLPACLSLGVSGTVVGRAGNGNGQGRAR
jgi:hypothetical protein